jgi:hypothetical protein
MKMQGIVSTGIIHPLKSLSVVHICQLCAYRMQNMTICKQFNGVQDSLESILCWNSQPRKSDARNCHYRYHIPPKVIIKIPNIWQCHASRMHNMTIHNQFHALRDELEQIQFQTLPRHNEDARNCHYRYHSPPKVIISSPYIPTLCI